MAKSRKKKPQPAKNREKFNSIHQNGSAYPSVRFGGVLPLEGEAKKTQSRPSVALDAARAACIHTFLLFSLTCLISRRLLDGGRDAARLGHQIVTSDPKI